VGVLIEACIFLFALSVLVIGGIHLVALTLTLGQTSAALHVHLGYVYLALPLSGLLMMFYSVRAALGHRTELEEWEARSDRVGEAH
jgi:TRAP-type C4-dicarboxylate transport system permease small subunit